MTMKKSFLLSVIYLSVASFAQDALLTIKDKMSKINTVKAANVFLKDTSIHGQLSNISSINDTSEVDKMLFSAAKGDIVEFASEDPSIGLLAKILSSKKSIHYRVNYIYLNQAELTKSTIDSLRQVIIQKLSQGEKFEDLAYKYSMDGSGENGGNLGWFTEGVMNKTFENAVKSHTLNQVYTVDIPENKWYYVVKNTYKPVMSEVRDILWVQVKVQ